MLSTFEASTLFFHPPKQDNYPSMLYKITRDGKVSYLYGTLHALFAETILLSAEAKLAFESAEMLVIESYYPTSEALEPDLQEVNNQVMNWLKNNIQSCSSEQKERLQVLFKGINPNFDLDVNFFSTFNLTPLQFFSILENDHIATLLTKEELAAKFESILVSKAMQWNVPIHGLEGVSGLIAHHGLHLNLEEQLDLLESQIPELEADRTLDQVSVVKHTYLTGHLSELRNSQTARYVSDVGQKYLQYFLVERDKQMAKAMEKHLHEGNAFIAVGASHLIGLIEQLSAQGFVIEPILEGKRLHTIQKLEKTLPNSGLAAV